MSGRITEFPSAFPHLRAAIGLRSAGPKGMPSITLVNTAAAKDKQLAPKKLKTFSIRASATMKEI
jgi:hypothetical protein